MDRDRFPIDTLQSKVMSSKEAAMLIKDGITVGMGGFTRACDAEAVPQALASHAEREPLHITLMTGASLGNGNDKLLTKAGTLARRLLFQPDPTPRAAIKQRRVMLIDWQPP